MIEETTAIGDAIGANRHNRLSWTSLGTDAPPAYLAYGLRDTLVPAATQGIPLALRWAAVRGEMLGAPGADVVLELADAGHNLDLSNFDHTTMEAWLDAVTRAPRS
jgi:hypothetical protein